MMKNSKKKKKKLDKSRGLMVTHINNINVSANQVALYLNGKI